MDLEAIKKRRYSIWKYQFDGARAELPIPKGAKVLSCGIQNDAITMWALVEPGQPEVVRRFEIWGTGHPIAEADIPRMLYIGRIDQPPYVWHLFEVTNA